jgi:hypothetical protein
MRIISITKMKDMKQTSKVMKTTGSFMNYLMGNNSTILVVGKGATILHWTDRSAYEVMSVSEDLKTVVVRQYNPQRIDGLGMSESQEYSYEPENLNPCEETIVWKWNAWRKVHKKIMFTKEYSSTIGPNWFRSEDSKNCYDENANLKLIEGKTHVVTEYEKINILWGVKRHYYDFSF